MVIGSSPIVRIKKAFFLLFSKKKNYCSSLGLFCCLLLFAFQQTHKKQNTSKQQFFLTETAKCLLLNRNFSISSFNRNCSFFFMGPSGSEQ